MLLPLVHHPPSAADDVTFGGSSCDAGRRRPDLLWIAADRAIKVGIDEHSHMDRTPECEMSKVCDQHVSFQALIGQHAPCFFVKWNPDEYDGRWVPLQQRVEALADRINKLCTMDLSLVDPRRPLVEYWFYHSKASFQIEYAMARPEAVVVIHDPGHCQIAFSVEDLCLPCEE